MILNLLQLASPALPLGGYSYSEGLETLVETGRITSAAQLESWIDASLRYGTIQLEAAIAIRAYRCILADNLPQLIAWNQWLSASKETVELRQQSWQMGQSLMRLLVDLEERPQVATYIESLLPPWNYAVAFGIGAACWQINEKDAILGYLHSWASNLISAGIKLIPLGQTAGQKLLKSIHSRLEVCTDLSLHLSDDELASCSWGLGLASMAHEIQYTRLFRS